jgi:hypothetical protein
MLERDLDKNPYSTDEQRVAEYFFRCGTGGGDDPIGALLASHAYVVAERNEANQKLQLYRAKFGEYVRGEYE